MKRTYLDSGAYISDDELYRYHLWRVWDEKLPRVLFVMLNPSTANALKDDPTITRLVGYAERWGFGRLDVVNLFAFRSPHPKVMRAYTGDRVGLYNNAAIFGQAHKTNQIIVAWGRNGDDYLERVGDVLKMLNPYELWCLGYTKLGQPLHPLMLKNEVTRVLFTPERS